MAKKKNVIVAANWVTEGISKFDYFHIFSLGEEGNKQQSKSRQCFAGLTNTD